MKNYGYKKPVNNFKKPAKKKKPVNKPVNNFKKPVKRKPRAY